MVSSVASASSDMNALVSLPLFSRILISGSRYVSMHLFKNWNMSLIVMIAILLREERRESESLVNCLTSECRVAPC